MDPGCKIFIEEDESATQTRLKYTMPLKRFVQAEKVDYNKADAKKKLRVATISGSKAKESYLNIVGDNSLLSYCEVSKSTKNCETSKVTKGCEASKRTKYHEASKSTKDCEASKSTKDVNTNAAHQGVTRESNSHLVSNMNVNNVMKAVEANDVQRVVKLMQVNEEFVLNATDQYGWTAMMNACCAGAKDVVELLLQHYPNLNIADKSGNTCLSLARSKGHKYIVKLLEDHVNTPDVMFEVADHKNHKDTSDSFYCDVCKETVSKSIQSHFTSTVHLFNSCRKSGVPTSYGIPENNVGFQILLKTGWDREKGLGPEGSGHKFPPKTMLKQDRAGLGAKKYVSRVTHNPALVVKDRSERQQTLNRRERMRNVIRSKRKERELRRMLD